METRHTAQDLIRLLDLRPHPEGGRFAFRFTSGERLPGGTERETCSVIYYLLQAGEISRWHRLGAAEVWTWHLGGSLEMTLGGAGDAPVPEGTRSLGPRLEAGEQFQILAPPGQWQTTRLVEGEFALVSCVVAPAFLEEDCLLPPEPLPNEIYGKEDAPWTSSRWRARPR